MATRGFRLRLAAPPAGFGVGEDVRVAVVSRDGRRELRERVAPAEDGSGVEIEIPPGWLRAGSYEAVIEASDGSRLGRYSFEIR